MRRAFRAFVCLALLAGASPAAAQSFESVGIRAQGMGGAFVAVADDATATWWNPAGLASGAYFNAVLERDRVQEPSTDRDPAGQPRPASRVDAGGFATAFPALGLSYYRLRVSEIRAASPTGGSGPGRQDQGPAAAGLSSLVLRQFGATVGQSLGDHLVVGATLKLVHGTVAGASVAPSDASLDRAASLDGPGQTHGDVDLGAMAVFGVARLGLAVRNVTRPTFGEGTDQMTLARQARAGVALTSGGYGALAALTVAVDADLTRRTTPAGDERRVAAGVETWLLGRRLGVRGGVSRSTVGTARGAGSGGVSVAVKSGLYVDAEATGGSDESLRGWGLALRVTF